MNSVMQEFTMYNGETYSGVQAEGSGYRLKAFRLKAGVPNTSV
jgi:hypothetical protein